MYLLNNNKFISKDCTRVKLYAIEIKDMKFAPFILDNLILIRERIFHI